MGEKRDKRKLIQRAELDKLMNSLEVTDLEFRDIINLVPVNRLEVRIQRRIRTLYNCLVHQ